MEEKDMIKIKKEKKVKVETIIDSNSLPDTAKDSLSHKEQRRKERIFLIQLIIVFIVWMFLLYLVMEDPKKKAAKKGKKHK